MPIDYHFVLKGLDDRDTDIQRGAAEQLREILTAHPLLADWVIEQLGAYSPQGQARMIDALAPSLVGRRDLAERLVEVGLRSEHEGVRNAAARSLRGSSQSLRIRNELLELAANDPAPAVRMNAVSALETCADLPEVRERLLTLTDDPDAGIRRSAHRALGASEVLRRMDPADGSPLRLRVIPSAEARDLVIALLDEADDAVAKLQDMGLSELQERIVSKELGPRLQDLRRLAGAAYSSIDGANAGRSDAIVTGARLRGIADVMAEESSGSDQGRLFGSIGQLVGGAIGGFLNSQT